MTKFKKLMAIAAVSMLGVQLVGASAAFAVTGSDSECDFGSDSLDITLGTDGFGRSDTRESLRRYFEIDAASIAAAAVSALVRDGSIEPTAAARLMADLGVDPGAVDPGDPA